LKNYKTIWLLNIGEPLPQDGSRPHRMSLWKNWLSSIGNKILFFTTDFEHQRKKWVKTLPKNYVKLSSYVPYYKNIGIRRLINHFFIYLSFIREAKKRKKPDLIIVSYPTILLSLAAVNYGKKNNIKVIVDVRDKWPDIFINSIYLKWILTPIVLIKKYIMKNSICISISPGYYEWATNKNKISFSHILPLSYSEKFSLVKRNIHSNKKIIFLFVGTLGLSFNSDLIISLYSVLKNNNINFRIDICGDGPEKVNFLKKIKNKKNIKFYGWVKKNKLDKILNKSNFGLVFYNSNSPQGWPNKLIEYISNGIPIINTLKGESWSLVKNKNIGINVEFENLDKIINLIKNPSFKNNYSTFCKNCNNTFQKLFSNKIIRNKLFKLTNN